MDRVRSGPLPEPPLCSPCTNPGYHSEYSPRSPHVPPFHGLNMRSAASSAVFDLNSSWQSGRSVSLKHTKAGHSSQKGVPCWQAGPPFIHVATATESLAPVKPMADSENNGPKRKSTPKSPADAFQFARCPLPRNGFPTFSDIFRHLARRCSKHPGSLALWGHIRAGDYTGLSGRGHV